MLGGQPSENSLLQSLKPAHKTRKKHQDPYNQKQGNNGKGGMMKRMQCKKKRERKGMI